MPFLLGWLGAMSTRAFVYAILGKVLIGLGVTVLSYVGIGALMDVVITNIQSQLGGLPADMAAILTIARVDDAISVVLSACVARMTLAGLTEGGALRRITWARQGPIVLN